MKGQPHDEPVFIRSRAHYHHNRRDPVGRLIAAALFASGWSLHDQYDGSC